MDTVADRVIRKFSCRPGDRGIRALARRLRMPHTTVASWLQRGLIPAPHQQRILDVARAAGILLTPADFFGISEASAVPPVAGVSHASAAGVRDSDHLGPDHLRADRYGMGDDAPVPPLRPEAALPAQRHEAALPAAE